ncbi:MAG TPA: hypothetical protein VGF69_20140 [Thermoanaerobaculia bacterium]|jgi:hypothetical protein
MVTRRAVAALVLVQLIAFAVSAQQSAEFGRASGGQLVLTPKGSAPLSGSLEFSLSSGNDALGGGSSPSYGMTAGGTLIQDRLWFFASASRQQTSSSTRFANLELPENATQNGTLGAIGGRVQGQLGAGQDLSAFFEAGRRAELATNGTSTFAAVVPSSFLSMRYNGVISSNMLFSASFTRSSHTVQGVGFVPAD